MTQILLKGFGDGGNNNTNSIQELQTILFSHVKYTEYGESPIDELGITQKDPEELLQLKTLLDNILNYPSAELAKFHKDCFRLGSQDLFKEQDLGKQPEEDMNVKFCSCCGFIQQKQPIPICTDLDYIKNIGVSTYLYFLTIRFVIAMLIILFLIFSIFSLTTNIIAAENYNAPQGGTEEAKKTQSNVGFLVLSLGSKLINTQQLQVNYQYYNAQCWIGVGIVLLWGLCLIFFKYRQIVSKNEIIVNSKSAADYSIMIQNVSTNLTKDQLQTQLNQYFAARKTKKDGWNQVQSLQIAKFNLTKPFYLNQDRLTSEKLVQLLQEQKILKEEFILWITTRIDQGEFPQAKKDRQAKYKRYHELQDEIQTVYEELAAKIRQQYLDDEDQEATTSVFVTFQSSYSKLFVLSSQHEGIGDKIRYYLTCCWGTNQFKIKDSQNYETQAYATSAPEPEDIIWINLGKSKKQLLVRKIITFLTTIVLLGISFAIAYGLSTAQQTDADNRYLSFFISLLISIFNIIIAQILRYLTALEMDYTETNHQASLGLKAVLALMINNIFTPIIVNNFIKQNIYGTNGLAYDVFLLALTNSFLLPLLKIFDAHYYFTRILLWHKNKPKNRIGIDQDELNRINENIQFQVGYEYVYIVNLFIFTAFFSTLQPIIPVFAITGLTIMYWAQRYSIFNRCQRPVPGGVTVNQTMFQLITFGILAFALGNFTWFFFQNQQPGYAIIPNIISCVLAFILFIFPYKSIVKKYFISDHIESQQLFSQNRIFLPSQYDRLNPLTSKLAIHQYMDYIKKYKDQLKNKTPNEIKAIQKLFIKQVGHNFRQQNNLGRFSSQAPMQEKILNGLLGNQDKNMNPLLLLNTVVPGNENKPLNFAVQNWMTKTQRKSHKKIPQNMPSFKFTKQEDVSPQNMIHHNDMGNKGNKGNNMPQNLPNTNNRTYNMTYNNMVPQNMLNNAKQNRSRRNKPNNPFGNLFGNHMNQMSHNHNPNHYTQPQNYHQNNPYYFSNNYHQNSNNQFSNNQYSNNQESNNQLSDNQFSNNQYSNNQFSNNQNRKFP